MKNPKIRVSRNYRYFIISSLLALAGFLGIFVSAISGSPHVVPISAGVIVAYVIALIVLTAAAARTTAGKVSDQKLSPMLGQLMVDVVLKLHMPVLICDLTGKIIWYNRSLGTLAGSRGALYGITLNKVCGLSPEEVSSEGIVNNVSLGDRIFSATSYEIKAADKNYVLMVFDDSTELTRLERKCFEEDTIIMYIIIDNLDEMLEYVQEIYRTASTEIVEILKGWAASSGAMLNEYERDKFILVTDRKNLEQEVSEKFSILDEIRNVKVGDGSLPVTVSIGVSNIEGTLAEKAKAAQAALDMALQRGGDQAVLKSVDGIEFFGGRTKTVQKRTKVKARVIANELVTNMTEADNVLVMGHKYADFDSIGACVGIARLADYCGVPVNIVVDSSDENVAACRSRFSSMAKYDGRFVDSREGLDLVKTGTMLVIVDVNNLAHIECPQLEENIDKVAIIDHHRKTAEFKTEPIISYIEPSASSACELISEMLEQTLSAGDLSKEEANMLLTGILLDTKQFSRNTGTRTFSAAQYLREEGASPSDAQDLFKTSLDDFVREARFENDVVIYRKVIAISRSDSEGVPQDRVAAAKAADKLLGISGIMASFALVKIDNSVHVSARSTGKINVQLILEELKGGGHFDSAGAQVEDSSVLEVLSMLKDSIDHYLDSNM
ncbi:MAG: DHH family phosphoesterase [Clostridia bacterium]|nr:DHH family phosphoesterase [Clostridia bacterium]